MGLGIYSWWKSIFSGDEYSNTTNCSLGFSSEPAYTYETGCGYCDWKGFCDNDAYCMRCCTNLLDPSVYNDCRGHILQINEIDNVTGAIINIPRSKAILMLNNTVEMKI